MVDFANLPTWYPDLPDDQKRGIRDLRDRLWERKKDRILPVSDGHTRASQLEHAAKRFFSVKEPFSFIRLGDGEMCMLGALYWPAGPPTWSGELMLENSGCKREAFFLRKPFIEAVLRCNLLGVWERNLPGTPDLTTHALLSMLGVSLPCPRAVEINVANYLLVKGHLFSWLAGRRVLLIGSLAPRLAHLWEDPKFQAYHERFGPLNKIRIAGSIEMPSRKGQGAWSAYERTLSQIKRPDYDVALLGCGTTAKPLSYQITKTHRTALDVGYIFDALVGERKNKRAIRPVLNKLKWPPETF